MTTSINMSAYDQLISTQLTQLQTAQTAEEVKNIFNCPGSMTGYFFSGSSDDFAWALIDSPWWDVNFIEGNYYFKATATNGDSFLYIEGDLDFTNTDQ